MSTLRKKILTLYTWKVEKGLGKLPSILGLHRTYCYPGVLNTSIQVYSFRVKLLKLSLYFLPLIIFKVSLLFEHLSSAIP